MLKRKTKLVSHPPYSDNIVTDENSTGHLGLNAFTHDNLLELGQTWLVDKHG